MLFSSYKVLLAGYSVVDPDPNPAFQVNPDPGALMTKNLRKYSWKKFIFFDQKCNLLILRSH